jgi:NAD-dependent deacetylase
VFSFQVFDVHGAFVMNGKPIALAKQLLHDANRLLFVTGAGISADSGIPTYRGVGGLYNGNLTDDGIAIEEALSGPMFDQSPEVTWKYLWQIGKACRGAEPNRAHQWLAGLENTRDEVWVMTQNVDGLHRRAGTRNLIEVHGHAYDLYCIQCQQYYDAMEWLGGYEDDLRDLPPRCTTCHGVVRPDVVLFGEMLPSRVLESFQKLAETDFDVVVSIGTSGQFPYILSAFEMARRFGKPTIDINPSVTNMTELATYHVPLGAAEAAEVLGEMNE